MNEKQLNIGYKISFHGIKFMHDGVLIRSLVKPDKVLAGLGLKKDDVVFEPGCGPGFFTIGAAQVAGYKGRVFSYDVNPYAIRYLRKKLNRKGLNNVTVEVRNASDSNLPDESVDFAFITGIPRAVGGFNKLMEEISRTLKPGGIFAYRSHGRGGTGFTPKELESWQLTPAPEKDSNGFEIFRKI